MNIRFSALLTDRQSYCYCPAKEGVHIEAFDIVQALTYPGYKLISQAEMDSVKQECESPWREVSCFYR